MPAVDHEQCQAELNLANAENHLLYGIPWPLEHGTACRMTSRHRDGWIKWFFAIMRCSCPCHKPHSEHQTAEAWSAITNE